jgi:hypothetical protein
VVRKPRTRDIVAKDLFGDDPEKPRSKWWWVLVAPGKVVLWLEYMYPERISGVFGSARRKKSPIIQVWYSIVFYMSFIFLLFMFIQGLLK